ncbi:hypothetical protein DFJ73DRAFT_796812 [Zopfochytrium polystomum]|nr:hypothetical protein DFJ73DRAFT_796812 [Zopfochytrium polystomum]
MSGTARAPTTTTTTATTLRGRFEDAADALNARLVRAGLPPLVNGPDTSRIGLSPYPAWGLSAAFIASAPQMIRKAPGWPSLVIGGGFAGVFGLSGYITSIDQENGPSMATAWGLVYGFSLIPHTLQSRRPGPILLSAAVAGATACYAYEFADYMLN